MDFIHDPYQPGETIAAIATPPGEGGVAIIRISGEKALDIADKVFSGSVHSYQTHTAHFGHIHENGKHVDDVLLLVMLGKRSFTGEDTVEVHCHGGRLITRRVLDVILHAGARAARPGEFSFKAFINGKLDLAQAEAIQELICAKNEHALDAAEEQLQGKLSIKISLFQQKITHIAAILEAWVDFPEEGLEFATLEEVCGELQEMCSEMQKLVDTFHDGKIVHDGVSLCLIGRPNVGKSSLLNALLDKERAIVSPQPGTTRDIVEDNLRLNGLNLRVIDTAGIREAVEAIEQEGVRRTHSEMTKADLILLVLDITEGLHHDDRQLLQKLPLNKTIITWNKQDLHHTEIPQLDAPHILTLSAKEKVGLENLHAKIQDVVWEHGPPSREEIIITNARHKEALCNAICAANKVIEGLHADLSPEFLAMDMRQCLNELGKVIGTNITEDILSAIFSTFCVGK